MAANPYTQNKYWVPPRKKLPVPEEFRAFTPWKPAAEAPVGSYDPAFDAQRENANQGFLYTAQDYDLGNIRRDNDYAQSKARAGEDYGLGKQYAATDHSSSLADLLSSRTRGEEDYGRSSSRLGEDYATTTTGIQRDYRNLGDSQAGNARAAGVATGGALAQALMKRTENQGIQQAGVDRSRDRGAQDLNTSRDRFLADNTTGVGRENDRYGRQSTDLDTTYGRGVQDLDTSYARTGWDATTGYQRAGVELGRFDRQLNTQTLQAAAQSGGLPTPPANESVNSKTGEAYRTVTYNGTIYHIYASGRKVPIRKAS